MYTSVMYQQPMMLQITEEQLRQHCPMKERSDKVHNMKNENSQHLFVNGNQHYYMYRPNNKHNNNKKQNHWIHTNGYNSRCLGPLQETLCPSRPPSRDSQTDSSSEDLNDLASKGVKRLHDMNGSHPQMIHSYTLQPHGYNNHCYQPNYKRRHPNCLPLPHRKHVPNGVSNYDIVPDRYLSRSELMQVKVTPNDLVSGCEWDQLSSDIWKRFLKSQQTSESYINKMKIFKLLYTNIKKELRYSVFIVGSTFNGFGSNSSDLDLCLVIRNHLFLDPRMDALMHLDNVKVLLSSINQKETDSCPFQNFDVIDAKVPLLKFRHCSGVDVDINCNNPVGILNTHLLHCYAKADWRVQPLVLLVKLWAQTHQINDAKNSTISSYSLALMVIHFLQCGVEPAVLPCLHNELPYKFRGDKEIHDINIQEKLELPPSQNSQPLGQLLLQFFQYYCNFEFVEKAISVRTGGILPKVVCQRYHSPKNEPRAWSWLNIEEPFDHTNTARAVYNEEKFRYIVAVFKASCQALQETRSLDSIFHVSVPSVALT